MTFDELWIQEEHEGLVSRMRGEYLTWKRHRRVRRSALASAAALVVAGVLVVNSFFSNPRNYDSVSCNRTTFPDSHWADVAANILTTPTI